MLVVINILGTSGKPKHKQQKPYIINNNPYVCDACGVHLEKWYEFCPCCGKPIQKRKRGRPRNSQKHKRR